MEMDRELVCWYLTSGFLIFLAVTFLDPPMPDTSDVPLTATPSSHLYINMYVDLSVNITVPKLPVISNVCLSYHYLKDSDLAPAPLEHTGALSNLPISTLKTSIRHWQSLGLISSNESAWQIEFIQSGRYGGVMREHMNVIKKHKQVVRGKTILVRSKHNKNNTGSILYTFQISGFSTGNNMDIVRTSDCENGWSIFKECKSQFTTTTTESNDEPKFQDEVKPNYTFSETVSAVHKAGEAKAIMEKVTVGCVNDLNGEVHPTWK